MIELAVQPKLYAVAACFKTRFRHALRVAPTPLLTLFRLAQLRFAANVGGDHDHGDVMNAFVNPGA